MRKFIFFIIKIFPALLMTLAIFTVFNISDKPYELRIDSVSEGMEVMLPAEDELEQVLAESAPEESSSQSEDFLPDQYQPEEIFADISFEFGDVSLPVPEFENFEVRGVETPVLKQKVSRKAAPAKTGQKGSTAFQLKDVDQKPSILHSVKPVYPAYALKTRIEGKVYVRLKLSIDGSVSDAVVIKANPEKIFDKAALDAVKQWKFSSAYKDKRRVAVWGVIVPISFTLTH